MQFEITKTWNGKHLEHLPAQLSFNAAKDGLEFRVNAPFFNDPGNPGGEPGQPFQNLWDYEGKVYRFQQQLRNPLFPWQFKTKYNM